MDNTAANYKSLVDAILPKLVDYMNDSQTGNISVLKQVEATKLANELGLAEWIKNGGLDETNLQGFLDIYLDNSQHMHHPRYIGHQVSSNHFASGIADFIQGAINNPMAIYEMGPSAAVVEQTIVNWMLSKAGWFTGESITDFSDVPQNGGGILTHGGSIANLTAMLAARAAIAPEAWVEGTPSGLAVLGSEVAHYSIARSLSMIGLGKKAMIPVKVRQNEVLDPDDLYRALQTAKDMGKRVMAVNANACATSTGLYDPIKEIGEFCREYDLWFHVDGAHGASALTDKRTAHYLDGLELADSMIWDTHKMLRTTTLCAAVLFKDARSLHQTFQQKGSYIFHQKEQPGFDLMPYAVECTKSAIGTKLFWVLAAEGETGLGNYVYHQYDITKQFYDLIDGQDDFMCPYQPEANILCFKYTAGDNTNDSQLAIRNEIVKRGNFYITSTEVAGVRYLRLTVINELTSLEDIEALLEEVREVGKLIEC